MSQIKCLVVGLLISQLPTILLMTWTNNALWTLCDETLLLLHFDQPDRTGPLRKSSITIESAVKATHMELTLSLVHLGRSTYSGTIDSLMIKVTRYNDWRSIYIVHLLFLRESHYGALLKVAIDRSIGKRVIVEHHDIALERFSCTNWFIAFFL